MNTLKINKQKNFTQIVLNRPQVHNAFNEEMMEELTQAFTDEAKDASVHFIILTGNGKSFCAGADLNYMKSAVKKDKKQNASESLKMVKMFQAIRDCPKPVICLVNGPAYGGAMGLIVCSDIVVAHEKSRFGFSEVRLGLTPSVISPFVVEKIGYSAARRLFITGEQFPPAYAQLIGLVHEVVTDENRGKVAEYFMKELASNDAKAMAEVKKLLQANQDLSGKQLTKFTVEQICERRASPEAQTRLKNFFERTEKAKAEKK